MNRFNRISVYDLLKFGLILVLAAFAYAIADPALPPESRPVLPAAVRVAPER